VLARSFAEVDDGSVAEDPVGRTRAGVPAERAQNVPVGGNKNQTISQSVD
jgi:hypothetical protein